jgi:hypothetical protein
MLKFIATAILTSSLSLVSDAAHADPKPEDTRIPSPDAIEKIYTGKTVRWANGCDAGIYFHDQSLARSFCRKGSGSIGFGNWSVNRKGSLCYDMTYFWLEGGFRERLDDRECMHHVVDGKGHLWVNWDGKPDWWPVTNKLLIDGFEFKQSITRMRGYLDL